MKPAEIKKLIIDSLSPDSSAENNRKKLEDSGVSYSFGTNFHDKVLDRIFNVAVTIDRKIEFVRSMNYVFYRIALPGVAAIVILLISIYLAQGSLSFNSFIGVGNSYDESIVCLLTGK